MHALGRNVDKEGQHWFYSASLEVPIGLKTAFPGLQRLYRVPEIANSELELSEQIVLWWHLTPGISVAEQFQQLRHWVPGAMVVAMSDVPNDMEALAVFSVMAKAYCNTHAGADVLLKVAQVVEGGGLWIGESIMQRLLNLPGVDAVSKATDEQPLAVGHWDAHLTLREKEVASAISSGATNRQIADQMGITERTVKAHVGSVLEKLHLKNRLQLALLVKDR